MLLRVLQYLLFLLVLLAGISFGYFNSQTVSFNYLAGSAEVGLVYLLLAAMALAMLATLGACAVRLLANGRELRRLRRQVRDQDTELRNLRNLPYRDA